MIILVINILFTPIGNLHLRNLNVGVCIALLINFFIYFIGDVHDYLSEKAISTDDKINFISRTKFKNTLFKIADVLKFATLLASILLSISFALKANDTAATVNILKMWLIFFIVGYTSRIKFQKSYISLLMIEVFLITLGVM